MEGLGKNAYAGMEHRWWKFVFGTAISLVVGVLPPVYLVVSLAVLVARWPGTAGLWAVVGLSAAINVFMVLIHRRTVRHFRLPAVHALMMPVSLGMYQVIVAGSVFQHYFRGGTVWKGRRYGAVVRNL